MGTIKTRFKTVVISGIRGAKLRSRKGTQKA